MPPQILTGPHLGLGAALTHRKWAPGLSCHPALFLGTGLPLGTGKTQPRGPREAAEGSQGDGAGPGACQDSWKRAGPQLRVDAMSSMGLA